VGEEGGRIGHPDLVLDGLKTRKRKGSLVPEKRKEPTSEGEKLETEKEAISLPQQPHGRGERGTSTCTLKGKKV